MVEVSVCVVMYNARRTAKRCAEALFSQSMSRDMEFVFVDDGSGDGCAEMLRDAVTRFPEVADRTKIVVLPENTGCGNARARAYAECSGKYVICCDVDDVPHRQWCELLHRKAVAEDADMVFCGYREMWSDGRCIERNGGAASTPEEAIAELVTGRAAGSLWNRMFRREVADLDWRSQMPPDIRCCEDLLMNLIMLPRCRKIARVDSVLYDYVHSDGSLVMALDSRSRRSIFAVMKSIVERFEGKLPFSVLQFAMRRALYAALSADVLSAKQWHAMWRRAKVGMWRDHNFGLLQKCVFYLACINFTLAHAVCRRRGRGNCG